uniref:Uncharacterized protein n=1 Tax=Vitis vinifera TaxID=29760 RepID=F6HY67_VITVI
MAATNSPRSILLTIFIFAMVLSPMVSPCDAARFTQRELLQGGPLCPACVCCSPLPPNGCCQCCASPAEQPVSP